MDDIREAVVDVQVAYDEYLGSTNASVEAAYALDRLGEAIDALARDVQTA